jgi:hypothetical protein
MTSKGLLDAAIFLLLLAPFALSCGAGLETSRADGLDLATMPEAVRDDYLMFARRCSKCHSLARPLQSDISTDTYWSEYVERMRRQPQSGISPREVPQILRFLHFYSTVIRTRTVENTPAEPPFARVSDAGDEP